MRVGTWEEQQQPPGKGSKQRRREQNLMKCRLSGVKRIAVFRALQLGDMLCAVPALRALRSRFPGATVCLVGLPWADSFAERYRWLVDDFMAFPGWPGLPEQSFSLNEISKFLAAAQRRKFNLALQMHGSGEVTNEIVRLFRAGDCAGFMPAGCSVAPGRCFIPYPSGHELRRCLALVYALGAQAESEEMEFPLLPSDYRQYEQLVQSWAVHGTGYVCVHPGARYKDRRWPPSNFSAVVHSLQELGEHVVITGSAEETAVAEEVAAASGTGSVHNIAGRTSLGGLAAIIKKAKLLICNDTGVSHLAAAVGTPSIVVFSGSEQDRWAPLDTKRHLAVCGGGASSVDEVNSSANAFLRKEVRDAA